MNKFELPLGIGRLGAMVHPSAPSASMAMAAQDMAERRILRIEAALRKAGISIDDLELPE